MSAAGNGKQSPPFRVVASEQIRAELKQLAREAIDRGRGEAFLAGVRSIWAQLTTAPLVFGEPQYRLPALGFQLRHGVVAPVVVNYAVQEEKKLVVIRGFKVLS